MARYINTADLCNVVMKNKTEYGRLATLIDNIVEEMVQQTSTADVVEREKIDKAIKEMERYSTFFEYANRHDLASAVDYCIGVIERNIGE